MIPDPTNILPLASLALVLANTQLSASSSRVSLVHHFRDIMQAVAVVALPFYMELPAGVFMYWLSNSAFSMLQIVGVRRILANPQGQSDQEFGGGRWGAKQVWRDGQEGVVRVNERVKETS
eukprot:6184622-Pleurochrysis_carterae.AAC.1